MSVWYWNAGVVRQVLEVVDGVLIEPDRHPPLQTLTYGHM